eukprot:1191150-Prorocentrum_minimum.AAC.2
MNTAVAFELWFHSQASMAYQSTRIPTHTYAYLLSPYLLFSANHSPSMSTTCIYQSGWMLAGSRGESS